MGFFSSLWEGVKTAAAVVASVPVLTPFLIADKLGIIDLDGKKDKQTTQQITEARKKVSQTTSLSEATTVQQVEDISKSLRDYRNFYESNAKTVEKILTDDVNNCFDDLIRRLKEREQLAKKFGMEQIEWKKDRLIGEINGTVTSAITRRLSLDDYECRKILDIKAGSERDRKMEQFTKEIIMDAKNDLAYRVGRTMRQLSDDISNFLEDTIANAENNAQREQNKFDNWAKDMENKNFDREKAQLEPRVKIYAIEQVEKILAA